MTSCVLFYISCTGVTVMHTCVLCSYWLLFFCLFVYLLWKSYLYFCWQSEHCWLGARRLVCNCRCTCLKERREIKEALILYDRLCCFVSVGMLICTVQLLQPIPAASQWASEYTEFGISICIWHFYAPAPIGWGIKQ